MNKSNIDIRDVIFYSSLLIIIIWFALKIGGVFNTPLIVEMIPIVTVAFGAGAFYHKITSTLVKFPNLEKAFWAMKTDVISMKADFGIMKSDFTVMKKDFTNMKTDIVTIKKDVEGIQKILS